LEVFMSEISFRTARFRRARIGFLAGALALGSVPAALGQTPLGTAFTYQGRLTEGATPASGSYDMEFRLFDSVGGPAQIGGPVTALGVSAAGGLFTVKLDFGSGVFTGNKRWLQIGVKPAGFVGVYALLSPRQELSAAPNALFATTANAVDWANVTNPPAIPAASNSVVSATSFGLPSSGGASAAFSRADHTHGTPPLPAIPVASNNVVSATSFGLSSSGGVSSGFSRADHTHGTPPLPASVLNAVQHPSGLPFYNIVAAGTVKGNGTASGAVYNSLSASAPSAGFVLLTFAGYNQALSAQYVVKVLPVGNDIVVGVSAFQASGILLSVRTGGAVVPLAALQTLPLMVEVSLFGP
jgi:hypothetical protein